MKTLFISDLHLDPSTPAIQQCFDNFITNCLNDSNEIEAIYILGDLFEVWIGDDASIPLYQHAIEQLRTLTSQSISVFVMHGNRDFLLGKEFEKVSGCQIIPDPYLLSINDQTIILTHGDHLCIDDKEYMNFRQMVRSDQWQQEFLSKSIEDRIAIAKSLREQSKQRAKNKAKEIMDVNQQAVESFMQTHQVHFMIHGHTHRPNTHHFQLDNTPAKRVVLPDWHPDAKIIELKDVL